MPRKRASTLVPLLSISSLLLLLGAGNAQRTSAPLDEPDLEEPTGFFEPGSLQSKYARKITFDQYVTYGLRAVSLVNGFDSDLHRYDNQLDLINSFARNLTYGDDLSALRAHIDSSETELLQDANELTLIENERNQANCAAQLDFVFEETLRLFRDYNSFTQSKRLDLIDFIDSFGAAPSEQLMMANSFWLGSFDQCRAARIERTETGAPAVRGRYCVAHLRLPTWTRARQAAKVSLGSESIKMGVCLPRSCNSISMLRHANRIEALIKLARLQQVPYSSLQLTQLYCLPDEDSPLRQFGPSARLFIGLVSAWLLLVAYASLKYELARAKRESLGQEPDLAAADSKLIQTFALRFACQKLFGETTAQQVATSKPDVAITEASFKKENIKSVAQLSNGAHLKSPVVMKIQHGGAAHPPKRAPKAAPAGLNLAVIDGIKVVSMVWLISAHTLLFFIRNISNGRQFWSILLDARFMTIMAGIFPVDSFFTVTGVLTSYLKFNKSPAPARDDSSCWSRRPMLTASYWLEIFAHRYLRFMPMYLLVFWYTRDLSEFVGQGPMWDYATASTSLRSICKRESLWVPLLFQANFKPIEQHCVKPAWYLANDYQYLLVTPLFMLLLIISRWLGYLVIGLSVLASVVMQFLTVYQQQPVWWWWGAQVGTSADESGPFTDYEALINFKPMFATYVLKDLWRLYVLPYNRIPPYLIGLLTGHLMYRCAKRGRSQAREKRPSDSLEATSSKESLISRAKPTPAADAAGGFSGPASAAATLNGLQEQEPVKSAEALRLIGAYADSSIWTPVALLLAVIYLPLATQLLEAQTGERARIGASLIIALMRLVWSLSVARLIYVCFAATLQPEGPARRSFVVDFLSSAKWRPWSKVCLSVLLIQWEIIAYMAQIQPVQNVTFSLLLAFVIICIIASYAIGLFVYLLFEFPLSQLEQLYISPKLFATKSKQSR